AADARVSPGSGVRRAARGDLGIRPDLRRRLPHVEAVAAQLLEAPETAELGPAALAGSRVRAGPSPAGARRFSRRAARRRAVSRADRVRAPRGLRHLAALQAHLRPGAAA